MKTIVIIQARMGSSRLPGKVLMPLQNDPVLHYVVERSRMIKGVNEVIVATSTLSGDDIIEQWCRDHQVPCFRGSEDDVLLRYYECALPYQPQYIIRVTSDCPFVDYNMASEIVAEMKKQPADIVRIEGELPRGLAVEMISFSALQYINEKGNKGRHREHVTYYAYEFPQEFVSTIYYAPKEVNKPEFRITLDTTEDYELCKAISKYFDGKIDIPSDKVVGYLEAHPEVAILNAHIEQKPVI